jgi:ADP-ribose pyrophosphatase YjhB (NUDIX family)
MPNNLKSIKNSYKSPYSNDIWEFEYFETDDFSNLDKEKTGQCYAVCYLQNEKGELENKICIVNNGKKRNWGLVGGTIEKGETFEETLKREIQEEGNLEVLEYRPIGYQIAGTQSSKDWGYQLRYFVIARKIGEFISDPAGSVTEIAFIDPLDVKKYFDWGNVGEEIFRKAAEIFKEYREK